MNKRELCMCCKLIPTNRHVLSALLFVDELQKDST